MALTNCRLYVRLFGRTSNFRGQAADAGTSTSSPLVVKRCWVLKPSRYGLFFSAKMVDEREDETADRANEHQPIKKFHARHLLPSGKKADHLRPAATNITHVQKVFNRCEKKSPEGSCVTFFVRTKKVTKENRARYDTSCIVRRAITAVIRDGLFSLPLQKKSPEGDGFNRTATERCRLSSQSPCDGGRLR